ncbi:MAG TPA: hypothetical protein PKX56_05715 [Marmoricola sp.]|nr:hypothetical protein [Marmoricola sp.]HNJ78833.1 hypothetical protein [Marmoricola sp.]HNN48562.1 hypothetical protein [Marmoricola sp.]
MKPRRSIMATALALSAALICSGPAQAAAGPFPDPGYQFTTVQADGHTPVALTCTAHPVLINTNGEDPNLLEQAKKAITRIAGASGLNLYYAGPTTENWASPSPTAAAMPTSPIRLSFERNASINQIYPGAIGIAGVPVQGDYYKRQIPWFKVVINVDTYETARSSPGGQVEADRGVYTTLIHELGHGLGLDHTSLNTQVMYFADDPSLVDFGVFDLAGLNQLGQAACASNQVAAPVTKKIKKTVTIHKTKKKRKKKRKQRRHQHFSQHRLAAPGEVSNPTTLRWNIYQ